MLYYIRDEKGDAIGFVYNDTKYYYKKNYQGDIIGIYDSNYDLIVNYKYDSWGKLISITDSNNNIITNISDIGYINPLRYRSYYYDTETALYYLNSRYYNPEWGRFINCDAILNIYSKQLLSLYNYCNNNPVNFIDYSGNSVLSIIVILAAGGVINYFFNGLMNISYGKDFNENGGKAFLFGLVDGSIFLLSGNIGPAFSFALNTSWRLEVSLDNAISNGGTVEEQLIYTGMNFALGTIGDNSVGKLSKKTSNKISEFIIQDIGTASINSFPYVQKGLNNTITNSSCKTNKDEIKIYIDTESMCPVNRFYSADLMEKTNKFYKKYL